MVVGVAVQDVTTHMLIKVKETKVGQNHFVDEKRSVQVVEETFIEARKVEDENEEEDTSYQANQTSLNTFDPAKTVGAEHSVVFVEEKVKEEVLHVKHLVKRWLSAMKEDSNVARLVRPYDLKKVLDDDLQRYFLKVERQVKVLTISSVVVKIS